MASVWKAAASLILVGHFIAILSVVLAAPGPSHSGPVLATIVNKTASPYLDTLLLNSAFRFYAPNPGPARLTWYRVERTDGTAEWFEMPGFDALPLRSIYQRGLAMSSFLDLQLGPNSEDPKRLAVSPAGNVCVKSFVRKLARECDLPERRITAVEIYTVHHRVLEPEQVAAGWSLYDFRLYRVCNLGRYTRDGISADFLSSENQFPTSVESSRLGARMCVDLANEKQNQDATEIVSHWPRPLRELISEIPQLLTLVADESELKGRIERLARSTSLDGEGNSRTVR